MLRKTLLAILCSGALISAPAFAAAPKELQSEQGTLEVDLPEAELARRKADWHPRPSEFNSGYIWKYAQQVGSARNGAVTHPGAAAEASCYADI